MNINFQEMLGNLMDTTDELQNKDICLITNEKLEENHVKLFCNHKFNYNPILNEVIKQKKFSSGLETQKLYSYQIKCPYCRNVQNKILPYNSKFPKYNNINWSLEHCMNVNKCCYVFMSGKKKNELCCKLTHGKYCLTHFKIMEKKKKK